MMLTKLFNAFIKPQKTQICKQWASNTITFKMSSMSTDAINISFSAEDEKKILNVINSRNIENLLQYSIAKEHAQNLELHRTNNGTFNSLEDLLEVKDMNKECLYKFYNSIINDKIQTHSKRNKRGLILAPKTFGSQKNVNTVLGIYTGTNMLSWSLLNRECEVLQWCYEILPENLSKENLHFLIKTILPIVIKLPKADRYVMQETFNQSYQQNNKFSFYIQLSTINTIIMSYLAMLNGEFNDLSVNSIFILRSNVLQKFYELKIDNEVISSQYALQKMLQENVELMETKKHLPRVLINTKLRNMYNARSSIYQEQISWSLLIALAFLETVVLQKTI